MSYGTDFNGFNGAKIDDVINSDHVIRTSARMTVLQAHPNTTVTTSPEQNTKEGKKLKMAAVRTSFPALFSHVNRSLSSCPGQLTRGFGASARLMSDITPILTRNAMTPVGPYSQAIKTPHAIYCSGQLPADAQGNIVEGSVGERTAAVLKALSAVLEEAGSSLDKIVKAQIFLTDMKDFAEMNAEYEKWIKHKPARSCVAVHQLPKGVDIEIECVALP